jgi:hypothetical protein
LVQICRKHGQSKYNQKDKEYSNHLVPQHINKSSVVILPSNFEFFTKHKEVSKSCLLVEKSMP